MEKFELPEKKGVSWNSWKRGKKSIPVTQLTPIHKLSRTSVVCNISIGQLGLTAWLPSLPAPAHLLISCMWETRKKSLIS